MLSASITPYITYACILAYVRKGVVQINSKLKYFNSQRIGCAKFEVVSLGRSNSSSINSTPNYTTSHSITNDNTIDYNKCSIIIIINISFLSTNITNNNENITIIIIIIIISSIIVVIIINIFIIIIIINVNVW
jgi:hypothetical protein